MDKLSIIKRPIEGDLNDFSKLFSDALSHSNGLLASVLEHIKKRTGKQMRPMLILLIAKNYGKISYVTQHSAVGLELLHTASLVHDDVVDESEERRGQKSVNAQYNNKVAVLVGDYLLSTALLNVSLTHNNLIVQNLAELGRTLAKGEILQLSNIENVEISEDVYYQVIEQKTAALFESCCAIGALSANASNEQIELAKKFGHDLGIIFQIKDDIFDYYDSDEIGKPTGNDMAEGKLTLPAIYALNSTGNQTMLDIARKVKDGTVSQNEIKQLVDFTKEHGGIEYAEKVMSQLHAECKKYILDNVSDPDIQESLFNYVEFVIQRTK
ncbi:MAG: polyprenyl synthetase family protein [Prevotella sp.]|nr:polyprenyl synthetase family protein [Prevotella sp.]